MAERETHRFPKGETCAECPARRYYHEGGRRYCERGHQIEGYVQFDIDAEDNFGKQGRIIRKKKEANVKQKKHMGGNEAKELYLECLQLILRKQIAWMIKDKGFDAELESVCRDLWQLRIRGFVGLTAAVRNQNDKGKGKENGGSSQATTQSQSQPSESRLVMYSSQAESEATTNDDALSHLQSRSRQDQLRIKSWSGESWVLPTAMDTLAIVYLGCLLRQEALRIGELVAWARNNRIPYLRAVSSRLGPGN